MDYTSKLLSPDVVDRTGAKLQAFYDGLPEEDKAGVTAVLLQAVKGPRIPLARALGAAAEVLGELASMPAVARCSVAGSLRRLRPSIGDVDLVVSCDEPAWVLDAVERLPLVDRVLGRQSWKAWLHTRLDIQLDLFVVPPHVWGGAIQFFTGSRTHNRRTSAIARERGLPLSDVFTSEDGLQLIVAAEEEDVYESLGMAWVPPPLREGTDEIDAAVKGSLTDLASLDDVRRWLTASPAVDGWPHDALRQFLVGVGL